MNRKELFLHCGETYGTKPEFLWESAPTFAVLRNEKSGKWYGAVMDIPRNRLGLKGEEHIDILNVKSDPLLIGSLLEEPGFFPAYHMNKGSWISVALDGTVEEEQIKFLLDISYDLVSLKIKKKKAPAKKTAAAE